MSAKQLKVQFSAKEVQISENKTSLRVKKGPGYYHGDDAEDDDKDDDLMKDPLLSKN